LQHRREKKCRSSRAFIVMISVVGTACGVIPPYTPEMNPIEQIWKELRKMGFKNEIFASLEKVVDRLCDVINNLSADVIRSVTGRDWIIRCFN